MAGKKFTVGASSPDIKGFDPAQDKLDFGDNSVHGMIAAKLKDGSVAVVNPWGVDDYQAVDVRWDQLDIENFAPVGNEHFRQDIGGILSWELGIGPRKSGTTYIRSHEYGKSEVIDDFDPKKDKLNFLYAGTRERMKVTDTNKGLKISFMPTNQRYLFRGVKKKDLIAKNIEFHFDQVMEDNLEIPFSLSELDVTLVSRSGLLTPPAPAGLTTDGDQTREGTNAHPAVGENDTIDTWEEIGDEHDHGHGEQPQDDPKDSPSNDDKGTDSGTPLISGQLEIQVEGDLYWGGMSGNFVITNVGNTDAKDWKFEFLTPHFDLESGSVNIQENVKSNDLREVTVQPQDWNKTIPQGESLTIGFNAKSVDLPKSGKLTESMFFAPGQIESPDPNEETNSPNPTNPDPSNPDQINQPDEPSQDDGVTTITGTAGKDLLLGSDQANVIFGLQNNDTLRGEAGHDRLDGGEGADKMFGGTGNDIFFVENKKDRPIEKKDEGVDTIVSSVNIGLKRYPDIENISLAGNAQTAIGNDLDNILTANAQKNKFKGAGGADTFVYNDTFDSVNVKKKANIIFDFSSNQDDKIDLSGIDASSLDVGQQQLKFIGSDKFSGDDGEIRFFKGKLQINTLQKLNDKSIDLEINLRFDRKKLTSFDQASLILEPSEDLPTDVGPVPTPGDGDQSKPEDGDQTKPGDGDSGKPDDSDQGKPGDGDSGKPDDSDQGKPGDGDSGKPDDNDQETPGDETSPFPEKPDSGSKSNYGVIGYWHNWTNSTAKYIPLVDVDPRYDQINISFAEPKTQLGADMQFKPAVESVSDFKAAVRRHQQNGTKVLISIGGANAPIELDDEEMKETFVTSMNNIIKEYGFDGLDIDLEGSSVILDPGDSNFKKPTTPKITYLIEAVKEIVKENEVNDKDFLLTAAPETQYVLGGYGNYGSAFGGYLPVLDGLREELDLLHVQYYNTGSQFAYTDDPKTPFGLLVEQSTPDFLVSMSEMLIAGFPVARSTNKSQYFEGFGASKIAPGLPATPAAAPAGGYMKPELTIEALDYLTTGDRDGYEGEYILRNPQGYADLGGIMTWSINWDKSEDGGTNPYEFANAYSTYFNDLAAQPDPNNPQPDPGSGRPSPVQPPSEPLVPDEENKPKPIDDDDTNKPINEDDKPQPGDDQSPLDPPVPDEENKPTPVDEGDKPQPGDEINPPDQVNPPSEQEPGSGNKQIVAYFENWGIYGRKYDVADIDVNDITHLNYSFMDVKSDGSVVLTDPYADIEKRFSESSSGKRIQRQFSADEWDQLSNSRKQSYKRVNAASDFETLMNPDGSAQVIAQPDAWYYGEGIPGKSYYGNFNQLRLVKELYPNVEIGFALGGWTLSGDFSVALGKKSGREKFTDDLIGILKQYEFFSVVDFDWEYPGGGGLESNSVSPDDGKNLALTLELLRTKLDTLENSSGRDFDISIATAGGVSKLQNLNIPGIDPYIDLYNVMTYDFHGGWENITGHQAAMTGDPDNLDVVTSMKFYKDLGVDMNKVILGAPTYTRAWGLVEPGSEFGYNQPGDKDAAKGSWEAGTYDYKSILKDVESNDYELIWDDEQKAAYIYDENDKIWSSFETPATIAGKSEFIEDTGLGGMMFWALSSDAQGENSLIKAANDVLNNGDSPLDVANRGPQFDDIIKGDGRFTMSDFTGYLTHSSVSASNVANNFGFDDTSRTKIQGKSRHHNLHGTDRDEHIISHHKKKGHDILSGRAGDDILESGPGRDVMHGGSGDDHFHVHTKGRATNYNFDTILDFSSRDDKLLLTDVNDVRFASVDSVKQLKRYLKRDENLIYDEQSGYLYFDFNGLAPGNGKNKAVIPTVLLNGSPDITEDHFISAQPT